MRDFCDIQGVSTASIRKRRLSINFCKAKRRLGADRYLDIRELRKGDRWIERRIAERRIVLLDG